jgi:hypothetical protein
MHTTIAHDVAHVLAKLGFASRRRSPRGWPPGSAAAGLTAGRGSGGMVQPDHLVSHPAEWSTRPMWTSPPDATVAAPLRRKDAKGARR